MKTSLVFQLPADSKKFGNALKSVSMKSVINSFDKFLLSNLQSKEVSEQDKLVYGSVRKELHLAINEQRIHFSKCTKE